MPELLEAANVSWRTYNPYGSNYDITSNSSMLLNSNVLQYFSQYQSSSTTLHQNAFGYYGPNVTGGLGSPNGPDDFAADVTSGQLPSVSWIIPRSGSTSIRRPAALGEWYIQQVLNTLLSNPAVWAKTVLFISWDENDGFFDHVSPPTAPTGTVGEYLTVNPLPSDASGVAGPLGLGVRVPMLVVSPFSVGGWVCSDTFDHTSQLRFLETRFGVTVPNLSTWRRSVTGDLTAGPASPRPPHYQAATAAGDFCVDHSTPDQQRVLTGPADRSQQRQPASVPTEETPQMPVQGHGFVKRTA